MPCTRGFNCDVDSNLARAIWALPTGEDVLVCKKPFGSGFLLYQKDEWNDKTGPAFEAAQDGCILRDDQYVVYHDPAWIVPQAVRDCAISQ